jgi:hypothetical protein
MRYSADGNEEAGGAGGSSGAPPHPAVESTAAVNKAPKKTRCTSLPPPRAPNPDEYFPRQMLTAKTMIVDHSFAAGYCHRKNRYNTPGIRLAM